MKFINVTKRITAGIGKDPSDHETFVIEAIRKMKELSVDQST
jgi:hypothetical protein